MSTAYQLPPQPLLEAYDELELEDVSGVHRRYTPACAFVSDEGDEPCAVYAVLDGSDESYFVGVRFPTGIIVADGWASPMWRDHVPLELLDAVAAWLQAHAL